MAKTETQFLKSKIYEHLEEHETISRIILDRKFADTLLREMLTSGPHKISQLQPDQVEIQGGFDSEFLILE